MTRLIGEHLTQRRNAKYWFRSRKAKEKKMVSEGEIREATRDHDGGCVVERHVSQAQRAATTTTGNLDTQMSKGCIKNVGKHSRLLRKKSFTTKRLLYLVLTSWSYQ